MIQPMRTANTIAPTALATPSLVPRTLAVKMIASMLMASPEYRNAVAGPACVYAGEKGKHRTGTNGQDCTGDGCDRVGENFSSLGSEILDDRGFFDKNRDGPGDKKGRD